MVLLHLWRVNVKTTGGFICLTLGSFYTVWRGIHHKCQLNPAEGEPALQQRSSPSSPWQPLAFFSRKLEQAQFRYSAFDRKHNIFLAHSMSSWHWQTLHVLERSKIKKVPNLGWIRFQLGQWIQTHKGENRLKKKKIDVLKSCMFPLKGYTGFFSSGIESVGKTK